MIWLELSRGTRGKALGSRAIAVLMAEDVSPERNYVTSPKSRRSIKRQANASVFSLTYPNNKQQAATHSTINYLVSLRNFSHRLDLPPAALVAAYRGFIAYHGGRKPPQPAP